MVGVLGVTGLGGVGWVSDGGIMGSEAGWGLRNGGGRWERWGKSFGGVGLQAGRAPNMRHSDEPSCIKHASSIIKASKDSASIILLKIEKGRNLVGRISVARVQPRTSKGSGKITLLRTIPTNGRRGSWGIRGAMGIELSSIGGGGSRDTRGNMEIELSGIGEGGGALAKCFSSKPHGTPHIES